MNTTPASQTDQQRRVAACLRACEGMTTEQLEGMVTESDDGVLALANEVCEAIWERHGIDLHGDDAIEGSDAVDTLSELYIQLENVVRYARTVRLP